MSKPKPFLTKPKPFDDASFVPVPRVPEWPVYQPEQLPAHWKKIAEIENPRPVNHYHWDFYYDGKMLIIYHSSDSINEFNGKPHRHIEQYEFPIEAAAWFVDNLPRFFKKPDEEGALPIDKFHLRGSAGGEELKIPRLVMTYAEGMPGYALLNLSRCEHPNMDLCQSFEMSDEFLFKQGMLELFKDIAARHRDGTL
ncbi:MAG: hypothetical protein ACRBCS_01365 [Cellvibrionaceae bacterium]